MDRFAEGHRVVRYDARGFGDAPLRGGPFSDADDLCALLDHLELEQAALVGNSMGGGTALELTLAHPERVWALVLVGSALKGVERSPDLVAFGEEEDALLEAGRIDEAVELNLRMWLGPVEAETRAQVGEMQRRTFEVLLAAYEGDPEPGPEVLLEPPAATRLREVRAPTLVIVGDGDAPGIQENTDRLAAEIPGARKEVIAGAKHLPALERPEEFNRIVLGFLAEA